VLFDPASADCLVFTYKEGLLSPIAHDLQLRVAAFTIEVDPETWRVEARFDARSVRVAGVMRNGVLRSDELGAADKRTIEDTIVRDVLRAERYPEIGFASAVARADGDELALSGVLDLCGRRRDIVVPARRDAGGWTAEIRVHQPDFGIRPYRAMLGTLRVQPDVTVRLRIRAGE
jgi:polyisoprenoid-binding protein YceI